ncbi:MAG: propanediol utilization protein [Bacilli bacterium]|nr:propanediol utilization protein [Bacilli bacterium]
MDKKILVETSAHHIHVTQEVLELLCGEGAQLECLKALSQPGQFASQVRLDVIYHAQIKDRKTGEIVKKDNVLKGLRILGPVRKENQVEISMTEARALKANVPVRESGDVAGTPGCTLFNPETGKSVDIECGMIVAKRHIHMTPEDAEEFGVKNGQIVKVAISEGLGRDAILGDVVIRVSPKYALAMHIDTDECNALGGGSNEVYGVIVD